jgi:hypothetical protein
MSSRSLLFLLLFVLAIFLAHRFDVPKQVKMGVTSLIYGGEMRNMKGFRVVVETLIPELEKGRLTQETLQKEISTMLEKAGIRTLEDTEWLNTSGKPLLNVTIYATKRGNDMFQYSVTIEVEKSESSGPGTYPEKIKTVWITSAMGEGSVSDIQAKITNEVQFFLKSHSGS